MDTREFYISVIYEERKSRPYKVHFERFGQLFSKIMHLIRSWSRYLIFLKIIIIVFFEKLIEILVLLLCQMRRITSSTGPNARH